MEQLNTYFTLKMPEPQERPELTFYYEKRDGSVFVCKAKEAALVHKTYKQVGVSDGSTYFKFLRIAVEHQNKSLRELEAKYKKKTKKYYELRQEIADVAKKSLLKAEEAEFKAAKGKFMLPPDNSGKFLGQKNAGVLASINSFLSRR